MNTLAAAPRRSRWIPWVFVGGFAIVVAANAALVVFAVNTFTGLTTSEPYTKGLRFNEQIRETEVYERLGWHLAVRFIPSGARHGGIEVKLTDRNGAAITDAAITAEFSRPVEKDRDFTLELRPRGGGRYTAEADFPLAGIWDAKYRIEHGAETLKARDRLQVQ